MGWPVSPRRCGAPCLGTVGSPFNPWIKHQESPLAAFLAGSSLLPLVQPQCGRGAFSPRAPDTDPGRGEVSPPRCEEGTEPLSTNQETPPPSRFKYRDTFPS